MGVSYVSDQVCAVCNTTKKRFIILSEPILESNLEFRQLNIEEANLIVILKCHHSFTEGVVLKVALYSIIFFKKENNE
ncbi:hypothetical protein AAZX31_05G006600 [Glycine max]|uniref:Uncharacterized protein n=1 Tax=Glycine max TaxID=3847 RepID=K7KNL4_SOYBN|nr:hypothetical protein JHK86_011417 [Glycine max]KAH1132184.1 hypothetical protein GYH30_011178 [Glycine max]KRH56592.1 hypothetical protein GLYMA_05G006500v4 [Glycine max]